MNFARRYRQTLTLRAGEIRNLRITLGAGGLYLAPVADGY